MKIKPYSKRRMLFLVLLIISLIAAFFLINPRRSCLKPGWDLEVDSFYHVRMADMGPGFCIQRTFPSTTQSVWNDRFYDKELGFHLILGSIRPVLIVAGLSDGNPPFNAETYVFIAVLLMIFGFAAWRIDAGTAFLWPPMFVLLSPSFANRCVMLRPHLLSIAILVTALFVFLSISGRRRIAFLISAIFGFIMFYSYSNPHFILLPAIAVFAAFFLHDRSKPYEIPAGALIGLLAGMIVHPQFPNTLILWKIQCVDVVIEMIAGSADISTGNELLAPSGQWLLLNSGVIVLAAVNIVTAGLIAWRARMILGKDTLALLILTAILTPALFLSTRVIEYLLPFTVLSSATLFRDVRDAGFMQAPGRRIAAYSLILLIFIPMLISQIWTFKFRNEPVREFKGFGKWAEKNLPMGTIVANVGWGDFTRLFYAAPHCRYLYGLDPMFGYMKNPEMAKAFTEFRKGKTAISPSEMFRLTGAVFVFVDNDDYALAEYMDKKLKYMPVYAGDDGYLFYIKSK